MKKGKTLRAMVAAPLFALVPLCSMTLATPAQAQQITGFNVDEVRHLAPGVELNFDLYGTAGGLATLRIDGATRNLRLTEVEPGQYSGTYTIGVHDRIAANSGVTANLRVGNRVATAALSESLLRGPGRYGDRRRGELASIPRVERFDVNAADDLGPGSDLTFTLNGTPGAKVEVTIAGSRGIFFLPEVRPGEYAGTYRIRRTDRILADSAVTATIRANGRYSSATLGRPLLAANAAPRVAHYCSNCATVEAINAIEVNGDGNYLGTIGGAVVGGLIGNSVGGGSGRTAATAVGAVGGALAGNNIERNSRGGHLRYEVVVRYANGATQAIQYESNPGFKVGDAVRVNNGTLTRD